MRLGQVGMFLAIRHPEEGESMAGSDFPADKKTILVVDDEPELVTMIRNILEENGYRVICAFDGPQVFEVLKKQTPDIILLDIMMPEMNGLDVLTRLKGDPETSSIPVFLLTAQDEYQEMLTGYDTGTDYYITKPFTRTQLMKSINLGLSWVSANQK
jgi:two-component system alkaline phosphatase synthesis response regulator PhoP